jgi:hypothetical protein
MKRFELSPSSGVPEAHAKQLDAIAPSIGRVILHTSHQTTVSSTGTVFVDNQHVITSSDILFPSHVAVPPLEAVQFQSASFSRRAMLDSGDFSLSFLLCYCAMLFANFQY